MATARNTGKGHSPRQAADLFARRKRVFERWTAGESQQAIGKSLRLTQQAISIDIQIALREWRAEHRGSINQHVEQELEKLFRAELLAWRKLDLIGDKSSDGHEWMRIVLKCCEERRKLLGLDAPARSEIKADVTVSRTFKPKSEMFQEILAGLERLRSQPPKPKGNS